MFNAGLEKGAGNIVQTEFEEAVLKRLHEITLSTEELDTDRNKCWVFVQSVQFNKFLL